MKQPSLLGDIREPHTVEQMLTDIDEKWSLANGASHFAREWAEDIGIRVTTGFIHDLCTRLIALEENR